MTIRIDVLGYTYDDAEPAFTHMDSGLYHHRITQRTYSVEAFDAWLVSVGKVFGPKELANQSDEYKATHLSLASRGTVKPPPPPDPTTQPVVGDGTQGILVPSKPTKPVKPGNSGNSNGNNP